MSKQTIKMPETKYMITMVNLLTQSEPRKESGFPMFFRASVAILIVVMITASTGRVNEEELPELSNQVAISLTEVSRYGDSDDHLIGVFSAIAVDEQNRVYIADRNQTVIHVFDEESDYLTSMGRKGRGPAEFSAITPNTTMQIHGDHLYVTDYANEWNFFPDRVQVFSLSDLQFSHTVNLLLDRDQRSSNLSGFYPMWVYPRKEGNLLVAYQRMPADYRDGESRIQYVLQTRKGEMIESDLYSQPDKTQLIYYVRNAPMPYEATHAFSFFPQSLFTVTSDDRFISARTDQFELSVYNASGEQVNQISHPVDPLPASRGELIGMYENRLPSLGEGVAAAMIREADDLPETWPVLRNLLSDDEGQIWASVVVEDFNLNEWWVLRPDGEVLGRFDWPRSKPIEVVRNGHVYTRETDEETGLQQVVRYRIEMP